jgi:peptidoglycan/LPS O-acetylase OafA/YrhL
MKQGMSDLSGRAEEHKLYLPALDGLRLIAFLLVLVHHTVPPANFPLLIKLHTYGWVGVEMFFVISSFLFFYLFKAEHHKFGQINIGRYYLRRLLRIYPLMVGFPLIIMFFFWERITSDQILRYIGLALFSDNLITWFRGYSSLPLSEHLWTLSFEFQVYLILPVAFFAFIRFGTKRFALGLAAVFAFCLALRLLFTALGAPHPIVWTTPFLHPDSILLGLLLSLGLISRAPIWVYVLIFGAAGFSFFNVPLPWTGVQAAALSYPLGSLMCVSLVILALRGRILGTVCSWKPIAFLGSISFGLYVYHRLGIYFTGQLFARLQWTVEPQVGLQQWGLFFGTSLVISAILATLSYYVLERPLLRLKDRFAVVHGR